MNDIVSSINSDKKILGERGWNWIQKIKMLKVL